MTEFSLFTLSLKPHLIDRINELSRQAWPEFLLHGNARHWSSLFDEFAQYQILFCSGNDRLIAVGHTVPLFWNGSGEDLPDDIDTILQRALQERGYTGKATALCALAIVVDPAYRGQGLSARMVREIKNLAKHYGMTNLIAPVRPTLKQAYPLVPFKKYINWKREDGAPFDHWIRVHWRLGAKIVKIIPRGLTVTGSIDDWRAWTGRDFPSSGDYEIRGALGPVHIDIDNNQGIYYDPNVWLVHEVGK